MRESACVAIVGLVWGLFGIGCGNRQQAPPVARTVVSKRQAAIDLRSCLKAKGISGLGYISAVTRTGAVAGVGKHKGEFKVLVFESEAQATQTDSLLAGVHGLSSVALAGGLVRVFDPDDEVPSEVVEACVSEVYP